jgi:alkanesulfonate monooxygenase SsuD/methylene tetrahydromethanopterin reductase-like flavin-dependent oxidoreductase (luciferase family)
MTTPLPALSLAAVPGRRKQTLELAREIERRGFAGIYCPSFGDGIGLCEALALTTERIPFGTSIANLYTRHVAEHAQTASLIHELSGGRFRFGIGVSHQPVHQRMGLRAGKPLEDVRTFVQELRAVPRVGELPPVVLAAMRRKMVALGGEIGQGIVFANAARSHMAFSLSHLPERAQRDPDFFIGDMIPTVIDDDVQAAAAVNRKTLLGYVSLPNYRNYWKEAGYVEEMEAIEKTIARGEADRLTEQMSDRWLRDVTLFGTAATVREGVEAWLETGVRTPILVPSSARGGQFRAFEELFAALE